MKSLEIKSYVREQKFLYVCLALGVLSASVLLIGSMHEKKWTLALIMGMVAVYASFIILSRLWHLLILAAVFFIPIRIDFYLFLKPTFYVQSHGLPVTAFDLLLFVMVAYWVYEIMAGREKFNFYPAISVPALAYVLFTGLSMFQAADKFYSFLVFILVLKSFVVFIYFANKINTREEMGYVVIALILGVLLQSFVGGIQYATGGLLGVFGEPATAKLDVMAGGSVLSRVGGTIGHPNGLAKYLNLCLPLLLCVVFARFNTMIKLLASTAFILGGFTELLTLSRGGWVAIGTTLIFTFYEIYKFYIGSRMKSMVLVSLSILFIAVVVLVGFKDVRARLFEDDYGVAQARIPMAMVALNIIQDRPLTGVGLNNYTTVMHSYDRTREAQTYKFPHPVHNSYLLIAAESGVPALLSFLWMIGAVLMWAKPSFRPHLSSFNLVQVGWVSGLMTWLVAGFFDRDFAGTNAMLWFTIAMIVATHRILEDETEGSVNEK